ncbi:hypothetical protein [Sinosporangium siamense]|uniref:hypothetical protein n=1 Tax=Sinosporangium siamense TaxID=1367973 RepID=UPI00194EC24F|nr:hypothetical protein [Sinosporangium siamense]
MIVTRTVRLAVPASRAALLPPEGLAVAPLAGAEGPVAVASVTVAVRTTAATA